VKGGREGGREGERKEGREKFQEGMNFKKQYVDKLAKELISFTNLVLEVSHNKTIAINSLMLRI
jgi:hypothetical protein